MREPRPAVDPEATYETSPLLERTQRKFWSQPTGVFCCPTALPAVPRVTHCPFDGGGVASRVGVRVFVGVDVDGGELVAVSVGVRVGVRVDVPV